MKLTRRKAIKWSIELWQWLAETGSDVKKDWPGWKRKTFQDEHITLDCFLCKKYYKIECIGCPLKIKEKGCCREDNKAHPYVKWFNANFEEERKEAAKNMVKILQEHYVEII